MELKEIKQTCKEIVDLINANNKGLIYRNYDTFLNWFGMTNKRNFEILNKVDRQLKNHNVTLWVGKEQLKSVADFKRGETITFRIEGTTNNEAKFQNAGTRKVGHKNAGTIQIVNEDSGINLYKHQEDAVENLQAKIIKTNKNPFAGLLVLPTGGGKTLTAAYWLAKNYLDKGKKILWIAHRHELLEQAKATFHERLAFQDIFNSKTSLDRKSVV